MGRLTLNVLLSFAQFEREVIGERVRDKIAASKRKGIWVGGPVPLGYRCTGKSPRRPGPSVSSLPAILNMKEARAAVRRIDSGVSRESTAYSESDSLQQCGHW